MSTELATRHQGTAAVARVERVAHYVDASLAPATRRAYSAALRSFRAWGAVCPASPETVAAYIAARADGVGGPRGSPLSPSTLAQHLAAIRWEHLRLYPDTPSPTSHPCVVDTMAGIRREAARSGSGPGAPHRQAAATVERLALMVARIDRGTLKGKRDAALLLFGFASAMRRSELAALEVGDLDVSGGGSGGLPGLLVRVKRSKTDQEGRGHTRAILRSTVEGSDLCPVAALGEWIEALAEWSPGGRVKGRLFRSITRHGRPGQSLLPAAVSEVVKVYAAAAGFDPREFGGHSLRAGFVTSAAERGAKAERIMDHTGHSSIAMVRVYTRRADAFEDHAGEGIL